MKKTIITLLIILLLPACGWGLPVNIYLKPVDLRATSFDVEILAEFPDLQPVLSWGLDIQFDDKLLWLDPKNIAISSPWTPGYPRDNDGLSGVSFPSPVTAPVLSLATLTFDIIASDTKNIVTSLIKADYNDPIDEGFFFLGYLGPLEVIFQNELEISLYGTSTPLDASSYAVSSKPVPEPATFLLVGIGLLGAGILQTKRTGKLRLD